MTKVDLVNRIAGSFGMTKSKAAKLVDEVFGEIGTSLTNGNEVTIHGFGKFGITNRKAREGRNPQTGKPIQVKASKLVKFKMQKALKDAVNA